MDRRWFLMLPLLLAAAAPAAAQDSVRSAATPGSVREDTIRADTTGFDPFRALLRRGDTANIRLRLGLKPLPPPLAVELAPPPGADAFFLRPRDTDWSGEWSDRARTALAERRNDMWLVSRGADGDLLPDTVTYLPPPPAPDTINESALPGLAGRYADLGIAVTGRAEMGGAWTRIKNCNVASVLNCNQGLIPQIKPDVQFGVRVGGTIADRIHVNVDYDQSREFDAANNISIYYQGLDDEILQRLEVGDVSIALPPSRFITSGIPAGNFGFKATGQLGPIDFQAVWAEQKGNVSTEELRLDAGGGSQGVVQQFEITFDDADYTSGQFFFLVDPDSIRGSPHINIKRLTTADAPASLRPADGTLEVYRTDQINPRSASVGYFLGHAASRAGTQQYSGHFQLLVPGDDYSVHSSGLWIVLASPLRRDQILAVSYVTVSGDTVGTLSAGRQDGGGAGETPRLRLLRGPVVGHYPGQPTWDYEMHHVYRLHTSSDVRQSSIEVDISLGQLSAGITYRYVGGQRLPLLQFFGLDEAGPYRQIDNAYIYQPTPAFGGSAGGDGVNGTFIVFPTLEPFAIPAGSPRAGVSSQEALDALVSDANTAIYEAEDPVVRGNSGRFRLHFSYEVHTEGLVSTFNLGAFGIREGSETLWLNGRELVRNEDYTINYQAGTVTLMNPQQLFATNTNPQIRATFEKKAIFQTAPTSVFGLTTEYDLGDRGYLNVMGLYQKEKAIQRRPRLGIEPGAILLGGVSGQLNLGSGWLDRALDAVPLLRTSGTSSISLSGELALSMPEPNVLGATFLDDFEGANDIPIFLSGNAWQLGSRPSSVVGAADALPAILNAGNAAELVWQSQYLDRNGKIAGALPPRIIDQQIRISGRGAISQVLWLTFGDSSNIGTGRRWRSITTVLSTQGADLTRSEYLEFYIWPLTGAEDMSLVIDIGTVGEDAFYLGPNGGLNGTYPDGEPWGLEILDEEASAAEQETWGPRFDKRGLWNQPCQAQRGKTYPRGDPRANCTVNNGRVDSEDLDGDGILDNLGADGAYYRYVVRLDELSPYLVRDSDGTGTPFRLYRIPLRGPNAIPVNGASDAIWRFIKHLRITIAGRAGEILALSRMRIVGSRWAKRNLDGVVVGRTGSVPGSAATRVRVGPVSRITDGAAYSSPPGVRAQLQDPSAQFGVGGTQFNESGLSIEYESLAPGERAEVYYRYPQDARNLLSYLQIRLWAVPRVGSWGENGAERLVVKIGTDENNFYLFQSPLGPPAGPDIGSGEWRELVIDFGQWFQLRADAEKILIQRDSATGPEPLILWNRDSTYAVVLQDRARAPNLSAVREISFAVYNSGSGPVTGGVWLNDIRLTGEVTDAGYAGRLDLNVNAGSFASANVSFVNRSPLFRQLNEDASYLSTNRLRVSGNAQLGQFLPSGWGVSLPVTVSHTRADEDPTFLARSDVRASELEGLRETGNRSTRVSMALSKQTPTSNPWLSLLVDGVSLRFGYNTSERNGINSRSLSEGINGGISYNRRLAPRTFDVTPGFVETMLGWLVPESLERSQLFRRITDAELRWTPESISFSSTYNDQHGRAYRYDEILVSPADSAVDPVRSAREGLDNSARISFRPFASLTAELSVASSRDLLPAARATEQKAARRAIRRVRSDVAGVDIGWETNRVVNTRISFTPDVVAWLRPNFSYTGYFDLRRNISQLDTVVIAGDSVPVLQQGMEASRRIQQSVMVEPAGLVQGVFGASPTDEGLFSRMIYELGRLVAPVTVSWTSRLASRFDRTTAEAGLGYQLGLGELREFRFMDGDTAIDATRAHGFDVSGGLSLPWQIQLDVGYSTTRATSRNVGASDVTVRTREWPDLGLQWARVPIPGLLTDFISNISLSTGFSRSTDRELIGTDRSTFGWSRTIPMSVRIGLTNGLSATYNGQFTRGMEEDGTGTSRNRSVARRFGLTGTFNAPGSLARRLEQPIRATMAYHFNRNKLCRVSTETGAGAAADDCVLYSGRINRRVNLTLDTTISDFNVGLQLNWYENESLVGTGQGRSEFELRLFGNFSFRAGSFSGGRR